MTTTPLLSSIQKDGFVIIPNLLTPSQLQTLRSSCLKTVERARQGEWKHVRTVPKQYPPWHEYGPEINIWGVQHLMHPDMPERDVFASIYFSDEVLDVVKELLGLKDLNTPDYADTKGHQTQHETDISTNGTKPNGTTPPKDPTSSTPQNPDSKLVMELFNLLISPSSGQNFQLEWHRDDIRPDLSSVEEQAQLTRKSPPTHQSHAQYNVALYEDSSLIVIPGSHRRIRTAQEREAGPYETNLPGQICVELKPGDAVFYDSNILHRGVYGGIDAEKEVGRMTLHGSVGLVGYGNERARQVLQHGVGEWVARAGFREEMENWERAEEMRIRLMDMGSGKDLGYSLVG